MNEQQSKAGDNEAPRYPSMQGFPSSLERSLRELSPLRPEEATVQAQAMTAWVVTKHLQCGIPAVVAIGIAVLLLTAGLLSPAVAAVFCASVSLLWWRAVSYYALPLKPARGLYEPIAPAEMDDLVSIGRREPLVAEEMRRWEAQQAPITYQFYQRAKVLDGVRWLERQR